MIIFEGRNGSTQVRCLAGCDPIEIIEVLRERDLWHTSANGWHDNGYPSSDDEAREQRNAEIAARRELNQRLTLQIWGEALDPVSTPAMDYLRDRKPSIVLPPSVAGETVRYHPKCPRGKERMPALIALMRSVETFEPMAIQRLFLRKEGDRIVKDGRGMMLGSAGGAAMMLTSRFHTFWDDLSFCPQLYVCEGLETGLALLQTGHRCVWALGSAGAIARFPVIFGVGHLVICADNDSNKDDVSLKASIECAMRWRATTHQRATVIMPNEPGTDFADCLPKAV